MASMMIDRVRDALGGAPPGVLAVYVFGSVARDTAKPSSDVDLGLLLSADPLPRLEDRMLDYEAQLERALGVRVQVVILNDAPPDLVHRVLRDGRLLVERDRAARIRFEVRARNLYFDLAPVLAEYRRRAIARAGLGR
jgi:predicted nucleotidyltransferase